MKRGSAVHQELEAQVHTTVTVDIETKEDAWGLRIWNIIEGLRTLQITGQTRELEIWGTVDGLVVNGVIDELSYICPDESLEESLETNEKNELPQNQRTINHYFKLPSDGPGVAVDNIPLRTVYITDVKTRSANTLPTGSSFRPTKMQLMLYHSLLKNLTSNRVDFAIISSRYNLEIHKPFSDSFIANIGSISNDAFCESGSDQFGSPCEETEQDALSTVLAHNSLYKLWTFMITQFQLTLGRDAGAVSPILNAEYRSSVDGRIIGNKAFTMDDAALRKYVQHELEWWKGDREPEGVIVQEAFKCQICEFADECDWRATKAKEAKTKFAHSARDAVSAP